jgi:5-(carboxyamino)imidazole ribonucleotide mutase
MPVATVGVDRGDNAGALAIQIMACSESKLAEAYANFRSEMTEKVISDDNSIQG